MQLDLLNSLSLKGLYDFDFLVTQRKKNYSPQNKDILKMMIFWLKKMKKGKKCKK